MSTSIYSIHDKLCEVFGIQSDSPIPNCIFEEIPDDMSPTWGGIPGQSNWWLKDKPSWNKGKSPSEETRKKISDTNKQKGINWNSTGATEAARQYHLGKKQSKEHIENRTSKRNRKVEVDGVIYKSLTEAAISLGVTITAISGRLTRGKSARYL